MLSEEEHTDWVYRSFRISYVSPVLSKDWQWCQSSLFFNFSPFLAFSRKHLREMSLPSLQNFPLKWLSLNFSAKWNKSSTRALETSVVPTITDSNCVNFFFSVSQAINYSKLENTSGRIENIFQKGNSAIITSTYKILKQMWEYEESKWKLPRLSGISFFTFVSCISSLPAPSHERIFRDMEGMWNKLCTGNLPLTQDLMCCVEDLTSSEASRIFSIVIYFFLIMSFSPIYLFW